jgi:hypothetical protein
MAREYVRAAWTRMHKDFLNVIVKYKHIRIRDVKKNETGFGLKS